MLSRRNVIILILVLLAVAAVATLPKNEVQQQALVSPSTTPTPVPTITPTGTTPSPAPTYIYQNGTYSADASYQTPDGPKNIEVTATITNDVLMAVTVKTDATWGTTAQYQARFKSGYSALVIGKSVDSISLSRVSGSSLTSKGFNAALAKIKAEAKS